MTSTLPNSKHLLGSLLTSNRQPDSVVAFNGHETYTWAQFQQHISNATRQLTNANQTRVALCFADSYQFAVAFLACCVMQKHIVLPGNYQPEAVNELDAEFDLLLHDEAMDKTLLKVTAETLVISTDVSAIADWSTLDTKAIALTLFTSGSSGKPKAIHKSLYQLETELEVLESLWGGQVESARFESTVSHQHIYGLLFRVLWPLSTGRAFSSQNLEFPEQVVHHATRDTVLISSPALLKRLSEEHQPTSLRCCFSSGGPLSHQAALHAHTLFSQWPIEVFGSTETGGIAYRQQKVATQPWALFPNIEASTNDEQCLKLKSEHIDGSNWYQTADQVHFHDEAHFELQGRTDRIVKIEEKRISLVEVEKRLDDLDWVEESAVIPMHEGNRLSLFAVLVLTESGQRELTQLGKGKFWLALRAQLRQWLEPVAIPRRIRTLEHIPLNSQGKRQVAEIEKLFKQQAKTEG